MLAVYQFLLSRGEEGGTDEELCAALGPDRRDSLRPRRYELVALGHVQDSGRRPPTRSGRGATVWTVTDLPYDPS
jgi:hypothetical protein